MRGVNTKIKYDVFDEVIETIKEDIKNEEVEVQPSYNLYIRVTLTVLKDFDLNIFNSRMLSAFSLCLGLKNRNDNKEVTYDLKENINYDIKVSYLYKVMLPDVHKTRDVIELAYLILKIIPMHSGSLEFCVFKPNKNERQTLFFMNSVPSNSLVRSVFHDAYRVVAKHIDRRLYMPVLYPIYGYGFKRIDSVVNDLLKEDATEYCIRRVIQKIQRRYNKDVSYREIDFRNSSYNWIKVYNLPEKQFRTYDALVNETFSSSSMAHYHTNHSYDEAKRTCRIFGFHCKRLIVCDGNDSKPNARCFLAILGDAEFSSSSLYLPFVKINFVRRQKTEELSLEELNKIWTIRLKDK